MKKKYLAAICLGLTMAFASFAASDADVFAAGNNNADAQDADGDGVTDDSGLRYTASGSDATIVGFDDKSGSPPSALVIPTTISVPATVTSSGQAVTYRVMAIADEAFIREIGIKSVTLPGGTDAKGGSGKNATTSATGIVSIGDRAFYQCYNLSSVAIPNTVMTIGTQAFSQCDALATLTVADGNRNYQATDNALYAINNNGEYTLIQYSPAASATTFEPTGTVVTRLTNIGDGAFAGAQKLEEVKLSASIKNIGLNAFYNCQALKSVQLSSAITTISDSAFESCRKLESITIPDSVTSIGLKAFKDCTSLKSITFGTGLNTIYQDAFYNCSSLTEVVFPYQLTSIGDYSFYDCSSLTKVVVPVSVTYIGTNAFANKSNLAIYTHQNSTAYTWANSNKVSVVKTWTVKFFSDQNELLKAEEIVDGESATPPDMGARDGYTLVWSAPYTNIRADVSITASWVRTYQITFSDPYNDRTKVVDVEPGKNANPPAWTMSGYNLKWDVTGGSYTGVYSDATVYAQWVDPATGFVITKDTKKPQAKKTTFTVDSASYYVASADVQNPTVKYMGNTDTTVTSVSIPATVTYENVRYKVCYVAREAFLNNTAITSVSIGSNVKQIGENAFSGCTSLSKVKIKSKIITKFGDSCFYGIAKKAKIYCYASKKAAYKKKIIASGLEKKAKFTYKSL